jgi:tetratricopeptide (TPR) repeat protein
MTTQRVIKVFIASPGDLAVERRAFKDTVDSLNKGFGRGANVIFEPLGWEDALAQVGRWSQSVINKDVDACEVFILVMYRRWGQEAPDAAPYSSYTEEEFHRALARFEKDGNPTIFVFFKHIDPGQMADPGEQLKKVLDFRKKLEASKKVLYHSFADETTFNAEIDKHLVAYARGECGPIVPGSAPILPDSVKSEMDAQRQAYEKAIAELEQLKKHSQRDAEAAAQARAQAKDAEARALAAEQVIAAKTSTDALELAEQAAKAALDGRLEEARQSFAKALDGTTNLRILSLGHEFYKRIGDLDEAERLLMRWLAVSGRDKPTAETAAALGNLGIIAQTRGDLDPADKLHNESLAINRKLGRLDGQAIQLANLGIIAKLREDFAGARRLWTQSRDLYAKLGAKQMEKNLQDWLDGLPPG